MSMSTTHPHLLALAPPYPLQPLQGGQGLSGTSSGSGCDFDFIGSSSKRLSANAKRDSARSEKKRSRLSFGLESAAENNGNVEPAAAAKFNQDHPTPSQTRNQIPTPTPRRRVKSDDSNPNSGAKLSRRASYHDKHQERTRPEKMDLQVVSSSCQWYTKTVTLDSHPDPIPTTHHHCFKTSTLLPSESLGMKKKSTSIDAQA